jgi:hypothetical protein
LAAAGNHRRFDDFVFAAEIGNDYGMRAGRNGEAESSVTIG